MLQIPPELVRFIRGRGTMERMTSVQKIVKQNYGFNIPVMMCFIDFVQAFDLEKWKKKLLKFYGEMKVPSHLIDLVESLYEYKAVTMGIDGKESEAFQDEQDVH